MPGIIEEEWNIVSGIWAILTIIICILVLFGVVFPYLMLHAECDFTCGCKIEGKPYDSFHGNIVRYLYAENGDLYAKLCNGETMRVDNFNSGVPV